MRMAASGNSRKIAAVAAIPSIPGRRTSMMTRFGRDRLYSSSAASPSPTSDTTSMSGSAFREAVKPMRTMKWSSTTRIRIGFLLVVKHLLRVLSNFDRDCCAFRWIALYVQATAHGLGSFAHIENAEMSCTTRLLRVETFAVVGHREPNESGSVPQLDGDGAGTPMLYRIPHRLLSNAQKVHLDGTRQANRLAFDLDLNAAIGRRKGCDDLA